jgi:hypothetical protein
MKVFYASKKCLNFLLKVNFITFYTGWGFLYSYYWYIINNRNHTEILHSQWIPKFMTAMLMTVLSVQFDHKPEDSAASWCEVTSYPRIWECPIQISDWTPGTVPELPL